MWQRAASPKVRVILRACWPVANQVLTLFLQLYRIAQLHKMDPFVE